jgi:hypothetical protein
MSNTQLVLVFEVLGLNLQKVGLPVEEDLRLARDPRIVARESGRHRRSKCLGTRKRIRCFGLRLVVTLAEHSAEQAFRHVRLPLACGRYSSTSAGLATKCGMEPRNGRSRTVNAKPRAPSAWVAC